MQIAIIEDERKLANSLAEGLKEEGYGVSVFYDAESAGRALFQGTTDVSLVILDLMLPRKNGFMFCRELREHHIGVPVLVLTALDTVEDKVAALDGGADDFISKPFSFDELVARVRALSRRPPVFQGSSLSVANVRIDPQMQKVFRDQTEIFLTRSEFQILQCLMEYGGKVVTREALLTYIGDVNANPEGNVIDVHIRNLRKKVDDKFSPKIIRTVRGVGYAIQQ